MALERDTTAPLLVYTDAMHRLQRMGVHFIRMGFVVWCPRLSLVFYSYYELPQEYVCRFLSYSLETLIAQGEGLAALAPMCSLPWLFRDRSVIHFVDNTVALSALINGYASKPDMGYIVNAFHAAQFSLRTRSWLEWVPSDANISDLPSRLELDEMFDLIPGAVYVPTVLPALSSWLEPFEFFAEHLHFSLV